MEHALAIEALVVELLLTASLVDIASRRLRIPYVVALVIGGLLITLPQPFRVSLTTELISLHLFS